jgi:hypothetical protein
LRGEIVAWAALAVSLLSISTPAVLTFSARAMTGPNHAMERTADRRMLHF